MLLVYLSLLWTCVAAIATPTEVYPFRTNLAPGDSYVLYWGYSSATITFEVHVKTPGWVGFGLSKSPSMDGADFVMGWMTAGEYKIHDYHVTLGGFPRLDRKQDWELIYGQRHGEVTVLKFTRLLDTCDDNDLRITEDTIRVIWAMGDLNMTSRPVYPGTSRGSASLQLIAHPDSMNHQLPEDARHFDLHNHNYSIPSAETTYWCQMFRLPDLGRKHHIIRVDPITDDQNLDILHHWVLLACYHDVPEQFADWSGDCFSPETPQATNCQAIMFAWGVGGGSIIFPSHAGIPIGHKGTPQYFKLATHYDNPNRISGRRDSSGLRMWLTPTLRQYDADTLTLGVVLSENQIVPPHAPAFSSYGYCTSDCLSKNFGEQKEIHVFSTLLHTHLLGRGVRVRHYRNGSELPFLSKDDQYDTERQDTRLLLKEVTIKKNDDIRVECIYNTEATDVSIQGGPNIWDEMCFAVLYYYPATSLSICQSVPTPQQNLAFLNLTGAFDQKGAFHVTSPGPYLGNTVNQVINQTDWQNARTRARYQQAVSGGGALLVCLNKQLDMTGIKFGNTPYLENSYEPLRMCQVPGPEVAALRSASWLLRAKIYYAVLSIYAILTFT